MEVITFKFQQCYVLTCQKCTWVTQSSEWPNRVGGEHVAWDKETGSGKVWGHRIKNVGAGFELRFDQVQSQSFFTLLSVKHKTLGSSPLTGAGGRGPPLNLLVLLVTQILIRHYHDAVLFPSTRKSRPLGTDSEVCSFSSVLLVLWAELVTSSILTWQHEGVHPLWATFYPHKTRKLFFDCVSP